MSLQEVLYLSAFGYSILQFMTKATSKLQIMKTLVTIQYELINKEYVLSTYFVIRKLIKINFINKLRIHSFRMMSKTNKLFSRLQKDLAILTNFSFYKVRISVVQIQ